MNQPSITSLYVDECKSAIDSGDYPTACRKISLLTGWLNDPIGDMVIHVERWRAENSASHAPSSVFESTALAVLDWLYKTKETPS